MGFQPRIQKAKADCPDRLPPQLYFSVPDLQCEVDVVNGARLPVFLQEHGGAF